MRKTLLKQLWSGGLMKMRAIYFLLFYCLLPVLLQAQVLPNVVTASSGTQTVGGNIVTVSSSGSAVYNTGSSCGADPYMIGSNIIGGAGSYTYSFAAPVNHVRLCVANIDINDDVQFVIDGVPYVLSFADLSPFTGNCPGLGFSNVILTSGNLSVNNGFGGARVDIQPASLVHTIEVFDGSSQGGGVNYNFSFTNDNIFIAQPFHDTSFCPGDTFMLNYITSVPLPANNVFTAYLSDSNGSFQSKTAIGSLMSNTSGVIQCIIPPNMPSGRKYRVRINGLTDSSADDQVDIHIKPIPKFTITGKTSLCQQDTLNWSMPYFPGLTNKWVLANNATPITNAGGIIVPNVDTNNSGAYYVTATLNGCTYSDTIQVVVKKLPPRPQAVQPAPACEGDTVNLVANGSVPGGSFDWYGPNGYHSGMQSPVINSIAANAGGYYKVTLTLSGCVASDSTMLTVHPTPKPKAANDGPVCTGNDLQLQVTDAMTGVNYTWTGPDSFTSNQQNTVVKKIHANGGGYYKVYAATQYGCHASDSTLVVLKPGAEAPIPAVDSISCLGDTLKLSIKNKDNGAAYQWLGTGGFDGHTADTAYIPKLTGPLVFQVFAMKNGCTSGGDTISVNVSPKPRVPTAGSNSPVKPGKELNLTALSSTPGVSYSWTGPNNFSSPDQNPVIANVLPTASGKYIVTVTANGCSSSAYVQVSVGTSIDNPYVIYPNPTSGSLRLVAQVQKDQSVAIALSDIAGHRIFYDEIATQSNLLNTTVDLPGGLTNGIYLLSVTLDGSVYTNRIVLRR